MPKLKYTGKKPTRLVGGIKMTTLQPGETLEVSEQKAKALLRNPKYWKSAEKSK